MRESELIWKYIFNSTIGAAKWLNKAAYVFETKFNSSYKQMCQFLMTFGLKLGNMKSEKIPILQNNRILKVSKHFIYFLMDGFVHRYDILTKQWIKLTHNIKCEASTPNWLIASHYFGLLEKGRSPRSYLKIYDLERDQLIQTYYSADQYMPACSKRKCLNHLIKFDNKLFRI